MAEGGTKPDSDPTIDETTESTKEEGNKMMVENGGGGSNYFKIRVVFIFQLL